MAKAAVKKPGRRSFIKTAMAIGAGLTFGSRLTKVSGSVPRFNDGDLPTRVLGKTGARVPLIAFGAGSRFMAVEAEEQWFPMLEYALDNGLYYWDTASTYKHGGRNEFSENRLGRILKDRRKEVFLASKVAERDADAAKRVLEESLKRLQTDYIDLYQVHSIDSLDDAKDIGRKGKVLEVLRDYKQQGVIRHIGFTGHKSVEGMKFCAANYDFDTMLMALNHWVQWDDRPEDHVIPVAAEKGLGIIAMKSIRPHENGIDIEPSRLIRYSIGLEHVCSTSVGMDSLEVMQKNVALLKNYQPLNKQEREQIQYALKPFHKNNKLEWLQEGYVDGVC